MQIVKAACNLTFRAQIATSMRSVLSTAAMAVVVAIVNRYMAQGKETLELIFLIASMVLAGASSYAFTHCMLWLAQGRPEGPETEILSALSTLAWRIRRERRPLGWSSEQE
jgi:PST family polysaccharide transporter